MAENLLNQLLNSEINSKDFFDWLFKLNYQDKKFVELSTKYRCSRTDFITFFLNFVHEEIESSINDKKPEPADDPPKRAQLDKSGSEINKSLSFPLDLSSELDDSVVTNTSSPKMTKVNSEQSVLSHYSPISPIYKSQNSFATPKTHKFNSQKSPICLGDFIITKRLSSKKKRHSDCGETKRRIKPTNLSQQKNTFHKSENSFNFNKSETDELPNERNLLAEERLKILSRNDLNVTSASPKKLTYTFSDSAEIKASPDRVTHKSQIDEIVNIYNKLIDTNFVLNLTSEIYFLISLLLKKQFYNADWGVEALKLTARQLFTSIHNVVYFAAKSLEGQGRVLANYDKSTIRLLTENERLRAFVPDLVGRLQNATVKVDHVTEIGQLRDNVCFNSDTDNRQNFPNDPSFHAFRKQRDMFYEILRIWEQHHLAPGYNFSISLGGKIKTLLSLYNEPTNFIHFARLFKAQLLSSCRNNSEQQQQQQQQQHFMADLDVDAQKLSKLRNRCVTKDSCQGLNALPKFSEGEEFYRDFVVTAANQCFNRHLADALIEEIIELNESTFNINELEDKDEVDASTKKAYYSCLRSLRILAKFLGFIESLPYKTEHNNYSDQLIATHLQIRRQVCPNFDVKTILQDSIRNRSVILCVPWLVKYLSMLDYITLKLPYYTIVHHNLFWLYRNFDWGPDCNVYLIKFCLGWFFELPHIPDNNYLQYCAETVCDLNGKHDGDVDLALDELEIVDQDILYFCCPYLDEIKKLLSSTLINNNVTIKHITPITALQSPDEIARKKIEQQLEEAFFNGQPISLRKTVEFVSERVASTCVKYVCGTVVPSHKKKALEKFKQSISSIENEDVEAQKAALKTKANQLAAICLKELQDACDEEITSICSQKIPKAIDSLVSFDILPQTKDVCVGITKKICVERIQQWVTSHVTLGVFSKDFNDEIQRLISNSDGKKIKKPVFMLPPGGTNTNHNDVTTSAAHLLEKYRDMCIAAVEQTKITKDDLLELLDETLRSIKERGDVNQCILATICTLLLDLSLLLLAHNSKIMSQDGVMSKSCDIWRLYFNGCNDLFKSLLCPRNVMIFAQSRNQTATWDAFAKFCACLIMNKMLSCDNFESQCTGIFRTEWDQGTLKHITDFLKTFVGLYRDEGGSSSDFTLLLDFFADYCEDL